MLRGIFLLPSEILVLVSVSPDPYLEYQQKKYCRNVYVEDRSAPAHHPIINHRSFPHCHHS
jgi:hypothetical protein